MRTLTRLLVLGFWLVSTQAEACNDADSYAAQFKLNEVMGGYDFLNHAAGDGSDPKALGAEHWYLRTKVVPWIATVQNTCVRREMYSYVSLDYDEIRDALQKSKPANDYYYYYYYWPRQQASMDAGSKLAATITTKPCKVGEIMISKRDGSYTCAAQPTFRQTTRTLPPGTLVTAPSSGTTVVTGYCAYQTFQSIPGVLQCPPGCPTSCKIPPWSSH